MPRLSTTALVRRDLARLAPSTDVAMVALREADNVTTIETVTPTGLTVVVAVALIDLGPTDLLVKPLAILTPTGDLIHRLGVKIPGSEGP